MCKFCSKNFSVLNNTMEHSGLEIALMRYKQGATLRVRYFPDHTYTTFQTQDVMVINHCPMCGRKLKEVADG